MNKRTNGTAYKNLMPSMTLPGGKRIIYVKSEGKANYAHSRA